MPSEAILLGGGGRKLQLHSTGHAKHTCYALTQSEHWQEKNSAQKPAGEGIISAAHHSKLNNQVLRPTCVAEGGVEHHKL